MQYVGIDYAKLRSHFTVMTPEGRVMKRGYVANTPEALATFMDALPPDHRAVVLEACRNWTVMHDLIAPYAQQITLAHPLKVKAIASARIKTDAIDSRTLTDLLRADLIPAAHIRPAAVRARQQVLRQRAFCTKLRTGVRNQIHTLLDRQAPALRTAYHAFKDVFTQAGRQWMQTAALPEAERVLLTRYLAVEQTLTEQQAATTAEVTAWLAEDRAMQLVDSIPGIGAVLAALIAVEIDGIVRFGSAGQLASYAGLVPSTYSSGVVTRHGPITKQGNRWLRWALIEAVWPAIRSNAALRRFYDRIKARRGANPAKVATARKLCALVFQVLTRQTPFEVTRRVVHAT
jgi:transposase